MAVALLVASLDDPKLLYSCAQIELNRAALGVTVNVVDPPAMFLATAMDTFAFAVKFVFTPFVYVFGLLSEAFNDASAPPFAPMQATIALPAVTVIAVVVNDAALLVPCSAFC